MKIGGLSFYFVLLFLMFCITATIVHALDANLSLSCGLPFQQDVQILDESKSVIMSMKLESRNLVLLKPHVLCNYHANALASLLYPLTILNAHLFVCFSSPTINMLPLTINSNTKSRGFTSLSCFVARMH